MLSIRVFAITIGVLVPSLAIAAGPFQGACTSEVRALCGSVQPGGGRIRDCMREHRAELSMACKAAIADRMLERAGQKPGGHLSPARSTSGSSSGN